MISSMSKGQTLLELDKMLKIFLVPDLFILDVNSYLKNSEQFISLIKIKFQNCLVAVRSSAASEDGVENTHAGEYDSVLNVPANNDEKLRNAIDVVIASYGQKNKSCKDEIIVQKMVLNSSMSGVIFTHDLNTGAPYYVINYDDTSGLTNTVTSGGGEYSNRTLYVHRSAVQSLRSERFRLLLDAIQELENIMGSQFLDVEFALSEDLTPYLLQVRAITTQPNWNRAVAKRIDAALYGIKHFVQKRLNAIPGIYGRTTVLGQMPDWNPAEMIGRAPKALAYSLYKKLITDNAWRVARQQMGYAVPSGQPLMISLAGQPFIDTRLSFHSYLPAELPGEIGEKLVNEWVSRLKLNPQLHDKVEFDVAITTFSFDIDEQIELLIGPALNTVERNMFKSALQRQTQNLLASDCEGSISNALAKLSKLKKKQQDEYKSAINKDVLMLHSMVDDCIELGTIPFSILARHGFIARAILLSLERRGILSKQQSQNIQCSFKTVASDLVDDMRRLKLGKLSQQEFMSTYGHLRPGTYDILSRRYDQMSTFGMSEMQVPFHQPMSIFTLTTEQKNDIDALLLEEGFSDINATSLFDYIKAATVGREYGKFVFTRSVSEILEIIADFGENNGLSREEMSHISIDHILSETTISSEGSIEERLRKIAEYESERHALSVAIRLPQVLFDEAGVHIVPFQVSHPNYITQKKITATCAYLTTETVPVDLTGKIVLIENADPGFDWIFAQQIGGLITKYGGANSHMAIRCAEFSIPAAIGCGEQRFEKFANSNQIHLDCAAGLINSLH